MGTPDIKELDRFERVMVFLVILLFFIFSATSLFAARISDVTNVVGVRDNQLIGYGLVVGLSGTGDGTTSTFTPQSLANLLQSVNIKIDPATIKSKNVAAVMITATLPPFARQGDQMDILVSSIGDAKSLEGGTLLMTPMKGIDGKIYGIAQGAITIGGLNSGGGGGQKNHATAGRVIGGGLVEREVRYDIYNQQYATLSLEYSDFQNVIRVQNAINRHYGVKVAVATDPKTIKLKRPSEVSMVEFLATVRELEIDMAPARKVIIDERTGTVIAGIDIEVKPVVVTHGEISLSVDPALLDDAETQKLTIANVTKALQRLGATPKDVIAILEAIKRAGALEASLEVI